jgi:hypothetical protein
LGQALFGWDARRNRRAERALPPQETGNTFGILCSGYVRGASALQSASGAFGELDFVLGARFLGVLFKGQRNELID